MHVNGAITLGDPHRPNGDFSYATPGGAAHQQVNIVHVVHSLLRGRYAITIALSLVIGVVAAALGYLLPVPRYRAEGLIRIQPVLPRILYESEQNTLPPMFSSFVNTQASLIQHSRVLNKAMDSDGWRALQRKRDPESEKNFRESLRVVTGRDAPELIMVSFTDEESQAAFIAVSEIINAYQDAFGGSETKAQRETQDRILTQRKQTLESQKRDLENRINLESSDFETDDLTRLAEHSLTQLLALDDRIAETAYALAEAGIDINDLPDSGGAAPVPSPTDPLDTPADLTPEQIAAFDRPMAELLREQTEIERRVELYRQNGLGAKHTAVTAINAELAALEKTIRARADTINAAATTADTAGSLPPAASDGQTPTPAQLVKRYQHLRKQSDALRARTELISKRRQQVDALRRELVTVEGNLAEVTRRLDEITVESKMTDSIGRIEAILPDAPPSTPTVDPRKKYAAMGLVLGGGFPFGLFMLIGLIDRRFRYSDQAGDRLGGVSMLGILPELPTTSADPDQTAAAVHSVHHIRSMLQLKDPSRKVYVVTSPTAGNGKTSLSLSLAMSFTASGARTLLVDFDLIGHGLSTRLGAARGNGIGRTLAEQGGIPPAEPTSVPRLDLVSCGREDAGYASRVSRDALAAAVKHYRDQYDAIVVDTGPILGSLEANLAAAVGDAVVMIVDRGQHSSDAQSALRQLGLLNARVAGIVFNRANTTDFSRSRSIGASFRSVRPGPAEPRPTTAITPAFEAMGPLARSVALDVHQ